MPFSEYSPKQKKLARIAEPRDAITGADFAALRKKDGGMIKFAEGGDVTRRSQLMQLLADAREKGDDDMIIEIEAELFQMGDDEGMMGGGYRYGGKVKGYRDGMSVSSDTGRGCGAAVKGKKFSGTY
jgi:hypothetical protein